MKLKNLAVILLSAIELYSCGDDDVTLPLEMTRLITDIKTLKKFG